MCVNKEQPFTFFHHRQHQQKEQQPKKIYNKNFMSAILCNKEMQIFSSSTISFCAPQY
jgi:hypothetical protein